MGLILLIVLVFVLVGCIPRYSYNREWGPGPSGFVSFLLLVLVILLVLRVLPIWF